MRRHLLSLCALAACGCASQADRPMAAARCAAPPGVAALWADASTRFIVIGEMHGTAETPAAFAETVCAASSGRTLVVGVEWDESKQSSFDDYLASAGAREDRLRFFEAAWPQRGQMADGRTSDAMMAMLERLRALRAGGADIRVAAFQRASPAGAQSQTPYEMALAASLREAAERHNPDLVLVLVGNLHARRTPVQGSRPFDPMAMHLPSETTLTVNAIPAGGDAWNCMNDACGPHPLHVPPKPPPLGVTLNDVRGDFDGVLAMGPATASPPYDGE